MYEVHGGKNLPKVKLIHICCKKNQTKNLGKISEKIQSGKTNLTFRQDCGVYFVWEVQG